MKAVSALLCHGTLECINAKQERYKILKRKYSPNFLCATRTSSEEEKHESFNEKVAGTSDTGRLTPCFENIRHRQAHPFSLTNIRHRQAHPLFFNRSSAVGAALDAFLLHQPLAQNLCRDVTESRIVDAFLSRLVSSSHSHSNEGSDIMESRIVEALLMHHLLP